MRRGLLPLLVVVAGMTTMATEMSASRLLAPFFGASVFVWANIIGLVLLYLAVGYWWGGRIADRHPEPGALALICFMAACGIGIIPLVAHPVLDHTVGAIGSFAAGELIGSFAGTIVLFCIPVTLLGMVPPFAVRLAVSDVDTSGTVAGRLFALSTIGSIVGTFVSALIAIPLIGTQRTMFCFAAALALVSVTVLPRRGVRFAVVPLIGALVAGAIVPPGIVRASTEGAVVAQRESPYQYIQVVRDPAGRMLLQMNEGWAVHSVYDPHTPLPGGDAGEEWEAFLTLPAFAEHFGSRGHFNVLVLGNAAGTVARELDALVPGTRVTGVELDPDVTALAKRYFAMTPAMVHVHTADARPFLMASHSKYDAIAIDAYRQPYIPFYLCTQQFFQLVAQHLQPNGVMAINVAVAPGEQHLLHAISSTVASVFPTTFRFSVDRYNSFVVATSRRLDTTHAIADLRADPLWRNSLTRTLMQQVVATIKPVGKHPRAVMTDDHAPVDWMTDRMIFDYALHAPKR